MAVEGNSYEDGLREGRLRGIEETISHHSDRLDKHDSRISSQEKISYAVLGALALMEVLPTLQKVLT